jgi:hypothetical protein
VHKMTILVQYMFDFIRKRMVFPWHKDEHLVVFFSPFSLNDDFDWRLKFKALQKYLTPEKRFVQEKSLLWEMKTNADSEEP